MLLTVFNPWLDELARARGSWSSDAVVHTCEVLQGNAENPQIMLFGSIPNGAHPDDGRATFAPDAEDFLAVVSLCEYRACYGHKP
jgi:hypothetical protein